MSGPNDEGASSQELLLGYCRQNNTEGLTELLEVMNETEDENGFANFLNNSTDALGNTAAHLAAQYGSYDVLDILLDQKGLEVDPLNRLEKETPLHKAVKYANENDKELGGAIVELLLDAGADPRILNKGKQRAVDLVDPRNQPLRKILQDAEYTIDNDGDVVNMDDEDDHVGAGSASDDD